VIAFLTKEHSKLIDAEIKEISNLMMAIAKQVAATFVAVILLSQAVPIKT
jgi:hypothetical protein